MVAHPRPRIVSHRTDMGRRPENSLAGIESAIAAGADGVEFDVRALADGVLVLVHDDSLRRTTGDGRRVDAVTLDEARALTLLDPAATAPPQHVPTLDEALAVFRGRAYPVVDLCVPGLVDSVAHAARRAGVADGCRLTGPDAHELAVLKRHLPAAVATLSVQAETGTGGARRAVDLAAALGLDGVNPDRRLVDDALMRAASAAGGLIVTTWTVDDVDEARRLAALGVDSITTHEPGALLAAL